MKKHISLLKKNIKKLLRPICNLYIGYLVFDFIERIFGYKRERQNVCKKIGYLPDIKNPRSFNEKILWKKFYDRNPLLPVVADKYRVRDYLRKVLGQKAAEKIMVPLFYVTDKPETIPLDTLKKEYVIKPNHASGMMILAEDIKGQKRYTFIKEEKIDNVIFDCKNARDEIVKTCKDWLSYPFGFFHHEWAYQKIKDRKIIIEKLLRNTNGKTPNDYKFFLFNGKYHFLLIEYDRYFEINRVLYAADWKLLKSYHGEREKKPENFKSMVNLAEELGKPFDCIRIDLYLVDGKIYFGEMTHYSASARSNFNPKSFDFKLGSKWKIVPNYWK